MLAPEQTPDGRLLAVLGGQRAPPSEVVPMSRLKEIGMVLGVIFIYMPLFLSWCAWDWLRRQYVSHGGPK